MQVEIFGGGRGPEGFSEACEEPLEHCAQVHYIKMFYNMELFCRNFVFDVLQTSKQTFQWLNMNVEWRTLKVQSYFNEGRFV